MNEKGTNKVNRIAVVGGGIGGLTFASHDAMLHHLGWIHGFDASNFAEPDERQGGTWL